MRRLQLQHSKSFRVLADTARSQAAEMTIAPGDFEGGPDNTHPKSDQWLYVISGSGEGVINGRRVALKEGDILLIEKGERHEIRATGRAPLRSLNFYAPPAY